MSYFTQLQSWTENVLFKEAPQSQEEMLQWLSLFQAQCEQDPQFFKKLMAFEGRTESTVVDLAKMLELLNHEDEFFQEQGVDLLLSYDSQEAWDALMTGAQIAERIEHNSFKMSPTLQRVLMSNPYFDYSRVTSLTLESPFADDLLALQYFSNLTELHLHIKDQDSRNFHSLQGLSELPKLTKLVLHLHNRNAHPTMFESDWTDHMGHIQELIFHNAYYYSPPVKYKMLDVLPNLQKCTVYGLPIDYSEAEFRYQPKFSIYSHDEKYRNDCKDVEKLLPKSPCNLEIATLDVQDCSTVDLEQLCHVKIGNLHLKKVSVRNVLAFANIDPKISITVEAIKVDNFWSQDSIKAAGGKSLEYLLQNPGIISQVLHRIHDTYKDTLTLGKSDTLHVGFQELTASRLILSALPRNLEFLPKSIRIVELRNLGKSYLPNSKYLPNVEEMIIEDTSFTIRDLGEFPNLKRITFVGGKRRLPSDLSHIEVVNI